MYLIVHLTFHLMDCEPLYQKLNVGKNIGFFLYF
jgi:hypothetical protein